MYLSVSVVDGFWAAKSWTQDRAEPRAITRTAKSAAGKPRGTAGEAPGKSTPPTLKLVSPRDGESVGKDVTLAVQAQAERGIDHITLSLSRIDGGAKSRGAHPVAELRPPQSVARASVERRIVSTDGDCI